MNDYQVKERYRVQPGTKVAPEQFHITIMENGPLMVYGRPPLKQQFLMPDEWGQMWYFKAGASYSTEHEPTALCRCGASSKKPYCDGAHAHAKWNPYLADQEKPLLEGAELYDGPKVALSDNIEYCAFARVCDAKGQVWNLVEMDDDKLAEYTIHEANHCPAGRLSAWDKQTQKPYELETEPALGLIEDPKIHCSGPLWVMGGIPLQRQDGSTYEVRNRVTVCRCGQSANQPFCNGAHASIKFRDGLEGEPTGEEI